MKLKNGKKNNTMMEYNVLEITLVLQRAWRPMASSKVLSACMVSTTVFWMLS
jgi:hypothetical protein